MKIILTSVALAGAGSFVVHANDVQNKLTIPMIIEKNETIENESDPSQSIFILVPHTECVFGNNAELEKSIRDCVATDKTWLKAI